MKISWQIGHKAVEEINLANLGYLYERQGAWAEAVTRYQQAIDLLEEIRSKAGRTEAKESLLAQNINVYVHMVKALFQLNNHQEAFSYAERSKSRSFLDQLAEAGAGVRKGVDPQLLAQEQNLYGQLGTTQKNLGIDDRILWEGKERNEQGKGVTGSKTGRDEAEEGDKIKTR